MSWIKAINGRAWIGTLLLIVGFREAAVWCMRLLGHPELGNLAGLLSLLTVLLIWRRWKSIPLSLVETNNKIMKESAFAFLPICAGALVMLTQMGNQIYGFMFVLLVSTLIPLWVYAKMAKHGL